MLDKKGNKRKKGKQFILIALTFLSAIVFPYQLFFSSNSSNHLTLWIYLIDIVFIISFAIDYKQSQKYKSNLDSSFSNFLINLFPNIPFDLIVIFIFPHILIKGISLFLFVRLFRMLRIFQLFQILNSWKKEDIVRSFKIQMTKFFIAITLFVHWIACIWFGLAYLNGFSEKSWILRNGFLDLEPFEQYIRSLYWVITTITTVGYGDITPILNYEYIMTIIIMLLGASLYAFVIGNIASMVSNSNLAKSNFQKKVDHSISFLKQRNLPNQLLNKVNDYYQYIWDKKKGQNEGEILNGLPKPLKLEIMNNLAAKMIQKTAIFQFTGPVLRNELINALYITSYPPKTKIIEEGARVDHIYFLIEGELQIIKDNKCIATFSPGEYFGDLPILLNEPASASVISNSFCEMFELSKTDFIQISTHYPRIKDVLKKASRLKSQKMANLLEDGIIL